MLALDFILEQRYAASFSRNPRIALIAAMMIASNLCAGKRADVVNVAFKSIQFKALFHVNDIRHTI